MNARLALGLVAFFIVIAAAGYWYWEINIPTSTPTANVRVSPDTTRKQFVHVLRQLVEAYVADHGSYPQSFQDLEPEYVVSASKFSTDPVTGKPLSYEVREDNTRVICASLSTGMQYCETVSHK